LIHCLFNLPRTEEFKMLSKAFGENVLWVSRVFSNRSPQISYLATIAETSDGKQHLIRIERLPTWIPVLPDTKELERFFR